MNLSKRMKKQSFNKELENCTFVKCLLMLIVLIGHSLHFWTGDWFTLTEPVYSSTVLKELSDFFSSFHVYCFTLVSGYIYYYLRYEQKRYNTFNKFTRNKIKRLIVPYFFVLIVWIIPIEAYINQYSFKTVIVNYILGSSPNQLWFLLMLFDVFIIYWFIGGFCKDHIFLGSLLIIVFQILSNSHVIPNVFQLSRALGYILFFWLGCVIRQYSLITKKSFRVVILILYCISYSCYLLIVKHHVLDNNVTDFCSLIVHVLGAISAFIILQIVGHRIKWYNSRSFQELSKRSMIIYFFHQQIIYFSIVVFNGCVNPYIHAMLNIFFSLSISLIISIPLLHFKATRILVGEKN
jgi:fucose 4-O-acetylase-like acetyltransferase